MQLAEKYNVFLRLRQLRLVIEDLGVPCPDGVEDDIMRFEGGYLTCTSLKNGIVVSKQNDVGRVLWSVKIIDDNPSYYGISYEEFMLATNDIVYGRD